jgi:hypothetical protein
MTDFAQSLTDYSNLFDKPLLKKLKDGVVVYNQKNHKYDQLIKQFENTFGF